MKIGQKGMSTSAIVAIVVTVVVVVVVVSVAAVLLIGGGGGVGVGSLPKYTGATSSTGASFGGASSFLKAGVGRENFGSISDEPQGLDDELYVAPATTTSVSEVMNWYKTNMASQGWTLVYEESYSYNYLGFSMSWGMLYFDKGDRSAAVVVAEYEGQIYFALVEGPDSLFDPWMSGAGYEWEEPTDGGGGGVGGLFGSATSVDMKVDATSEGQTQTMRYRAKNLQTPSSMKMRIDGTITGVGEFITIIDVGQNMMYAYAGGYWTQMSVDMSSINQYESYESQLSDWTGGDYNYTYGGVTIRIYDIVLNPDLPDSLFQHG